MKPILEIKNVSKKYRIDHERKPYLNIRESISNFFVNFNTSKEDFWALSDVSFEVFPGETIGIIGKNGAGKSTLLKILSRITPPTSGSIISRGRIASLLEVGTGFHNELSGRENIFLNGSILGMKRKEIENKFDEIVDFSGVEKFLDTPLKHYSSGMQLRLAFAVAAFLEPEILMIDEVLAVGDAEFQKKCMGKMEDVSKSGRTILFVSHSMATIKQLCKKLVLLENGKVMANGYEKNDIINQYLKINTNNQYPTVWNNEHKEFVNDFFTPVTFFVGDENGNVLNNPFKRDTDLYIHLEGTVKKINTLLTIGYALYNFDENDTLVYWTYHTDSLPEQVTQIEEGTVRIRSKIPSNYLNEGRYRVELIGGIHFKQWLFDPYQYTPSVFINIIGPMSPSDFWINKRPGIIAPTIPWNNY